MTITPNLKSGKWHFLDISPPWKWAILVAQKWHIWTDWNVRAARATNPTSGIQDGEIGTFSKGLFFGHSCPWKLTILGLKSVGCLKWPHFELSRPSKCSILGLKSVCRLKMALFWPQLSFKMLDFVLKIEDRKSRNRKILGLQKSLTSQNGTILSSLALENARFWVSKNAWRLKMAPLWRSLPLENARFCGRNTTSQQSKPKELIVRSLKLGISRSLQAAWDDMGSTRCHWRQIECFWGSENGVGGERVSVTDFQITICIPACPGPS